MTMDKDLIYFALMFYGRPHLRDVAVGLAEGLSYGEMSNLYNVPRATVAHRATQVRKHVEKCKSDPDRMMVLNVLRSL